MNKYFDKYSNIHTPVLLNEIIELMNIKNGTNVLDATFGMGGHSKEIISKFGDKSRLIIIDKDPLSIKYANELFAEDKRIISINDSFSNIDNILEYIDFNSKFDNILFDLGISSYQLDKSKRGFSFKENCDLDMRMNPNNGISAKEWINNATEIQIGEVLKYYGEERFYKRIAKGIINFRIGRSIETTNDLLNIIKKVIPFVDKNKHYGTRTFQAIRIHVNSELTEIFNALNGILKWIKPFGKLFVISFNSLEDRIVKRFFNEQFKEKNIGYIQISENSYIKKNANFKIKNKDYIGFITPTDNEVSRNKRARSAVLRVCYKV